MVKAELTNGTKIFVLKIEQYVSLSVFTKALGNQLYNEISSETEEIIHKCDGFIFDHRKSIDDTKFEEMVDEFFNNLTFFKKLTKSNSEQILRDSLKQYGRDGSIEQELFEASYERGMIVNKCYDLAREWVKEKYPYLKPNEE